MPRFDPIYLNERDTEDVATFFGLELDFCRDRIWDYGPAEMAARWEEIHPQTPAEIREFYRKTELYVWELTQWHASASRERYRKIVNAVIDLCPPDSHPRVLDFGAGIGTDVIGFAERGYSVFFADVPGITAEFTKHRLRRRGLEAVFLPVTRDIPAVPGMFDIILCFDVLEHVPNPMDILRLFHRHLSSRGIAAIVATFEDAGNHPCHLHSNFAEAQGDGWYKTMKRTGWRLVEGHLYRKASSLELVLDLPLNVSRIGQLERRLRRNRSLKRSATLASHTLKQIHTVFGIPRWRRKHKKAS
jgi:SAM-dependent methyltransferase